MAREGIPSAVLLDALGTLVELETPWPHLRGAAPRAASCVAEEAARAAMLAEMAYYRAHHDEARDWAGLKDLRGRCAAVVQGARHGAAAGRRRGRPAGGDPLPRLSRSARRARGACARPARGWPSSRNWDVPLHDVLERTACARWSTPSSSRPSRVAAKPDPAIFRAALERLGVAPADAIHVGDSVEHDVAGARAAGLEAVPSPATARGRPPACASSRRWTGCLMT